MFDWLRKRISDKAHEEICCFLTYEKPQIVVTENGGVFNDRCYENCMQYVHERPEDNLKVVEVIYIQDNIWPALHYLVMNLNGEYFEITLGRYAKIHRYYFIRFIPDGCDIGYVFNEACRYWNKKYIKGWRRIFAWDEKVV